MYRVPLIMQLHSGENGMATLAMILAYYKKYVSIENVRKECLATRNNTPVRQLMKAAEHFSLSADIIENPTIEKIKELKRPVVIRCGRDYDIITGFRLGKVYFTHSFFGKYAITEEAFLKKLAISTVICFQPTEAFVPEGKPDSFFAPLIRRFAINKKSCITLFLLYFVSAAATIGMLFASRSMMDDCLSTGSGAKVPFLMTAMWIIVLANLITAVATPVIVYKSSMKMSARSGSTLYKKMLSLPMQFYETHFAGDLLDRVFNNIKLDRQYLSVIIPKLVDFFLVFIFLLVLFFFNPILAAVCLVTEVVFIAAYAGIMARLGVVTKSLSVLQSNLSSDTINGINLIDTIKTTGAERSFFKVWCQAETAYDTAQKKFIKLDALALLMNDVSDFVTQGLLLFVGAFMIIDGQFTFGGMAVFQTLINQLEKTLRKSLNMLNQYQRVKVDIERSDDVLKRESQRKTELNEEPDKLSGDIVFDRVTFSYCKGDKPVLKDLSFELKSGEIIALVGETGSGKSSILKLLSDLYEPDSGSIRIGGRKMEDIPTDVLRSSIATVDQEVTMFVDSIKNNLKLWDECIEDYEMILAARDAQIHSRIIASSDGYGEQIQENGRNFSGGELQRMSLARALSTEPTILILDEFTSALDMITEKKVFEAIRNRNAGICILAAHRLSTVMLCDRVMVIEKGRIIENGTPTELYNRGGKFRQLVDNG